MILKLLINTACVYAGAIGFGILVNVPRRAFNFDGLVSVIGYLVYDLYIMFVGGYIGANLLGTIAIGLSSTVASKQKRLPVIIFNIPGLIPLVPGGQAYQVIRNALVGQNYLAEYYLIQVIYIAGSIGFGFLIVELLLQIYFKAVKVIKRTRC